MRTSPKSPQALTSPRLELTHNPVYQKTHRPDFPRSCHVRNVHLGELGYFHVTLKSKGVLEEKDVNPSLIEEAKVRFIAGPVLEKELKNVAFEKAAEPKK